MTIALVEAVAGNGTGPRESGVPADNGTDHTHRDMNGAGINSSLINSYYITTRPDSTMEYTVASLVIRIRYRGNCPGTGQ